ncbi:MAG: divalent metal cation transporter, partial [Patescibacteria group bacterium]
MALSDDLADEAKKIVSAPAVAVEAVVEATAAVVGSPAVARPLKRARDFWHRLGPGLTTGAADDDPAGIATYSQAGAAHGWRYLWLAWLTWPLMALVQEMCARIGLATGRGLAANIRAFLPRPLLYLTTLVLLAANTFNLGADLGAMAAAGKLIWPGLNHLTLLIVPTAVILIAQIFFSFRLFAAVLKWLTLVLLAYVLTAFFIDGLDWTAIWRSAVKIDLIFSLSYIILVEAILGT